MGMEMDMEMDMDMDMDMDMEMEMDMEMDMDMEMEMDMEIDMEMDVEMDVEMEMNNRQRLIDTLAPFAESLGIASLWRWIDKTLHLSEYAEQRMEVSRYREMVTNPGAYDQAVMDRRTRDHTGLRATVEVGRTHTPQPIQTDSTPSSVQTGSSQNGSIRAQDELWVVDATSEPLGVSALVIDAAGCPCDEYWGALLIGEPNQEMDLDFMYWETEAEIAHQVELIMEECRALNRMREEIGKTLDEVVYKPQTEVTPGVSLLGVECPNKTPVKEKAKTKKRTSRAERKPQPPEERLSRHEMQRLLRVAGLKATGTNEELEQRLDESSRKLRKEVG